MKRLLALMLCAMSLGVGATAPPGYCLSIEEYAVHDAGELAGLTTYRVYLNCVHATDYLFACGGDADNPLVINSSSGTWYNSGYNQSWNASGLQPAFFGAFPELEFDSFLTIGSSNSFGPELQIVGITDLTAEFVGGPDIGTASYGENVIVDDEAGVAWITAGPFPGLPDAETNLAFAGEDLRILVMQVTTAGILSGQIFMQVFEEGNQANEWRDLIPLGGCECAGVIDPCGVCSGSGVAGCLDEQACNFDPDVTCDDGSCLYLDGCGVCGGTGYAACTNVMACNYDPQASCDSGSCEYESCAGCIDPSACNYDFLATLDDFSCDYTCIGCTDPVACNYDTNATINDFCIYISDGECDCDGNAEDAIGDCGGDCVEDLDGDGICDDVDDCIGVLDPCGICDGPGEVYECGCYNPIPGFCDCDWNQYDALGVCGGTCPADVDGDGVCDDIDDCVGAFDACGVCNGPGDIYECGCADIPDGDCDCDGNLLDAIGVCGGDCAADVDADGICDDVDDCVGALDACGVCNGPGEIYECGCEDIPEGDCDCGGNQFDALGVCGGDCAEDVDADGICDDVDPCVGQLDACGVCNGPGSIYDCGCSDIPEGDCDCDGNQLDALGVCGGDCAEDANSDGICDDLVDCVNVGAAFWQDLELGVYISAEQSPVIYDSLPIYGIQLTVGEDFTNELVLNAPLVFVDEVTGGAFQVLSWSNLTAEGLPPGVELILPQDLEGGSQACVELTGDDYPTLEGFYEVVITGEMLLNFFGTPFSIGDVSTSFWVEVVSNPNGVPGCTYPTASNYMPWATYDSGACEFAGCTDPTALNYSPTHSVDDGSCFYNDPNCVAEVDCAEDLNGDGAIGTPDLLLMLSEFGNTCD